MPIWASYVDSTRSLFEVVPTKEGAPTSRVLVAEDDRGTIRIVNRILSTEGYDIIEAQNGGSAYATAVSEKPDVILLDLKMPVMDGFEVLKRLRGNPSTKETPVVLMTGVPPEKGELVGAKFGVRHYITKPLDPSTLKLAVKVAIRDGQPQIEESKQEATPPGPEDPVLLVELDDDDQDKQLIKIGNPILDAKLAGGIPAGSLVFIEGAPAGGKSVLCQQLAYSSISEGLDVAYFTLEDNQKGLVKQMKSLGMDVSEYFRTDKFSIFPMEPPGENDDPNHLLSSFAHKMARLPNSYKTIAVDSVTSLAATCEDRVIMGFYTACKRTCLSGRTIITSSHSYTFEDKMLVRLRAICDVHLRLREPLNNSAQAWMGRVVPFFGDVQASL